MKLTNHLKIAICLIATATLVGCVSPGDTYTRSTGRFIDDSATTSRVKSALGKDSLVKGSEVNVSTFRGNVHLTGFVDHPIQKERAAQITRNIEGVEWFKNDIVVKSELPTSAGQPISEPAGAGRDYQQQRYSNGASSQNSAGSGWQKGRGSVDSAQAGMSRSVKSTDNTSGIYESSGASSELSQRINTQLRSDNSLNAQSVQVQAAPNGKVTLRGMVNTDNEKRAIERQVKSIQGVSSVDNQLEVREP